MALAENLNRAIVKGDLNLVQKLVAEGAAMDFMLGMRGTALCAALSANQTDIAQFLIEAGCGVNVEDYDKEPPIFLAISKKCFDVVHRLTRHPKCNLNKYDPLTNVSPLALAVKNNHQDVVKWFIEAGADLNVTDHTDSTALHIAIQDRNYDMMDMLVKGGCDLLKNDSTGRYSIHIIASKGDERGLKILLQKWIDVSDKLPTEFYMYSFLSTIDQVNVRQLLNKTTKAGLSTSTPLHFAISNGHSLMSQFLLRYGSSPNGPEDRLAESPLLSAISAASCQTGQIDAFLVSWLLQAGANPNACGKLTSTTLFTYVESPIMLACRLNNVEVFELLIQHGANLDMTHADIGRVNRKSLLTIAFSHSAIEIAKCLLYKYKVLDIEVDDTESCLEESLLMSLSDLYHPEVEEFAKIVLSHEKPSEKTLHDCLSNSIIKNNIHFALALLRHGDVDVNHLNADGFGPIHNCIRGSSANKDFLLKLLQSGSDINMPSAEGLTPLEMCLEYFDEDHLDLAYFLIEAGCVLPNKFQTSVDMESGDKLSDSDDSDDSDNEDFYDDADCPAAFTEDRKLQKIVTSLQRHPQSLLQRCLHVLRMHFAHNRLAFKSINILPLPRKLLEMLMFKRFQHNLRIS